MYKITDLDVHNRFSWHSVLEMLSELCDDTAEFSFDSRLWEGKRIPTLELRLDAPDLLKEPAITEQDDAVFERWGNNVVVLCHRRPEVLPTGNLWFLLKNGNAALIYRAFREMTRVLVGLHRPTEFAWSSLPLVPLSDDLEQTLLREQEAFQKRAIHTIWLRSDSDEDLKKALATLKPCGTIRLQNMKTANTWVRENS